MPLRGFTRAMGWDGAVLATALVSACLVPAGCASSDACPGAADSALCRSDARVADTGPVDGVFRDGGPPSCTAGAVCDTGNPCATGRIDCGAGVPLCVPDFTSPPSPAMCGTSGVCGTGGACSECVQGAVCDTGNPCSSGAVDCTTGASSCEAVDDLPPGVGCGIGLACNESGSCATCVAGAACDTGNPCSSGRIDCGSGGPVCIATDDVPPGTVCGTSGVCGGAGMCSVCVPGASCDTGSPCATGRLDCAAGGAGVCVAMEDLAPGTACGTGLACSDIGACSTCVAGDACVVSGECNAGRTSCVGGVPVCRATSVAPAGAVCRSATGACDHAERCNGVAATCPPDTRAAAGTPCPVGACDAAGVCVATCPGVGLSPCPGGCVDLSADAANCGACGNVCTAPTGSCYLGSCECGLDAVCDGVCVSLTSNRNHCGECGFRCGAGQRCQGGSCCTGC